MGMMFDNDEQLRCAFAAFALQGIMSNIEPEALESEHHMRFIAEACFDMADMMMGVRNATARH
jgi:hypothetical protein